MTLTDKNRERIILTARSCVGSPFRHQGRNLEKGLDCVGLILYVARQLGISLPAHQGYGRHVCAGTIANSVVAHFFDPTVVSDVLPGDIFLLDVGHGQEHVAIFTGRGLIHACAKRAGLWNIV